MLDEEELMGRESLPPIVNDFEDEEEYEAQQRLLRSPSEMTFSAEEGMAVADQTDGDDRTITTDVTNVRPAGQLEPVEERPEGKFVSSAVREIFDGIPMEQEPESRPSPSTRTSARATPLEPAALDYRAPGDFSAPDRRNVTAKEVSVDQPGRLRNTAMEAPRSFGTSVATDAMDERRSAAAGALDLPEDRRGAEFDSDMTFSEEEGQAAADEFEQSEADRERRQGMSLDDLINEASADAQDQEPTVTDEAVRGALDRMEQGAGLEEAAEQSVQEAAEDEASESPDEESGMSRRTVRGIVNALQAIFAAVAVASDPGAAGGVAEGALAQIQGRNQRAAEQRQFEARMQEQRTAREGEQGYRDRQLAQQQSQFDDQQGLRERQEGRADRELDLTAEQAELQNQMSRLEIAAQEQGNELTSSDELSRIWGAYSGAGRTSDMTRDEFIAQEITNRDLNATLGERFPVPRRPTGGRSGRRGRRQGGPGGTTTVVSSADSLYEGQVDVPSRWRNSQINQYNTLPAHTRSAIAVGYRPPGWFGEGSEAVNPELLQEQVEAGSARAQARTDAVDATRTAIEAASQQDEGERIVRSYMPGRGRVLSNEENANEVVVRHRLATVDDETLTRQLNTLENSRAAISAYNREYNNLERLGENDANLRAAALSMSTSDFIQAFSDSDEESHRMAVRAMQRMGAAGNAAISLIRDAENWGAVTLQEREQVERELGNPANGVNLVTGQDRANARGFFNARMNPLVQSQRRYLYGGSGNPPQVESRPNTFTFTDNRGRRVMGVPNSQMRTIIREVVQRYPDARARNRILGDMNIQRTAG